jgi:hypothetical protein
MPCVSRICAVDGGLWLSKLTQDQLAPSQLKPSQLED